MITLQDTEIELIGLLDSGQLTAKQHQAVSRALIEVTITIDNR